MPSRLSARTKRFEQGSQEHSALHIMGAHNHLTHPPTHHPQTLSVVQAASMRCFTRSRSRSVDTAADAPDSASSSCLRAAAASARRACTLSCNIGDGVQVGGWCAVGWGAVGCNVELLGVLQLLESCCSVRPHGLHIVLQHLKEQGGCVAVR